MPPDVNVDIVERVGVDLAPVDATTSAGQLRLRAFVWADQVQRLARLEAACQVASQVPAKLVASDAITAVQQLSLTPGTWTVLWHSVFRQYLDSGRYAELDRAIDALAAQATSAARFAHLTLEPDANSSPDAFPVVLTTWPGARRRALGTAPAHGLPVTWLDDRATGTTLS